MTFNKNLFIFFILILLVSYSYIFCDTLITASDEKINYYGRFDLSKPAKPIFNWSGATIEANIPGPLFGIHLEDGYADYEVEIDGKVDTIIRTDATKKYIIKTNLSEEYHIVRIIQRSENHYNKASFGGFYIANGKTLGPAPQKPSRKIEFIGDSYTAGYGVESNKRECNEEEIRKFTNVNLSFATLVSKVFHAQSIILGWSGAGMVRNYGDSNKRSKRPFPYYYDKIFGEADTTLLWDFSKWIPDLVVICLGTNDFSTSPQPDDSMFVGDYHNFIAKIRNNYSEIPILCVGTDDSKLQQLVKKIVDEEKTVYKREKIFFAKFPQTEKTTCHWHLSIKDNQNIAKVLTDTIIKKLDWDTSAISSILREESFSGRRIKPEIIESPIKPNGTLSCIQYPFYIVNLRGEKIFLLNSKRGVLFSRDLGFNGNGLFIYGNNIYGWEKEKISIRK